MVELRFGIEGEKELRRRLSKARRALTDFRPWLKQASLLAIETSQANIDAGGRPSWVALSPETRPKDDPVPLRDTDLLINSISDPATHEDGVFEMDNFAVEVGTNLEYAGPQHFGTKDGHIPARPFMFLDDDDEGKILLLLEEFLDKALGPA